VVAFLTDLAVKRQVSPSTQNQALNALVFLYRRVLDRPLGDMLGAVRAKRPQRLPVILTRTEVRQLFANLDGPHWLPACLLYGFPTRWRASTRAPRLSRVGSMCSPRVSAVLIPAPG